MSKFSDATLYLAPSGYKEGILFPQKPLSTNGEISFTRASSAWRTNIEGQVEETCYNLLQYSEDFSNAAWSKSFVTVTANTTIAPDGNLTADTIASTGSNSFIYQPFSAVAGTTYTFTCYVKSVSGATTLDIALLNASGVSAIANISFTTSDTWQRISITGTSTTTQNAWATLGGGATFTTGETIYVWGAQLVQGSLPRPYLSTTNRQNFPRVDYSLGTGTFLLEPQRTNGVRNSTMQGTVLGTPGTNPTNWGALSSAGLNQSIIATGIESGLSYVDYRFNGTATLGIVRFFFEGTTTIAAVDGQTWASSVYLKVISGTYDGAAVGFTGRTSAGASAGTTVLPGVTITSTLKRFTAVGALASATVAYVQPQLDIYVTSGLSYDFTIRIAQPQIELGAYVTSPIFTTSSAVTRIADSFSRGNIFTNNLISSSGGTWFVELKNNVALSADTSNAGFWLGTNNSNTSSNGTFYFRQGGGLQGTNLWAYIGGVGSQIYFIGTADAKIAIKWNGSTADVFVNSVKVVSSLSFNIVNMEFLSSGSGVGRPFFIQQMALWRTPLTDAQCQELTL